MTLSRVSKRISLALILLLCSLSLRAQSDSLQATTQERLDSEPWWPTPIQPPPYRLRRL